MMKIRSRMLTVLLIALVSFLSGYLLNHGGIKGERKVLYYVDPMNPSYKSDKPGIAPGCGMPLEPVYADTGQLSANDGVGRPSMPPGAIWISLERQQLIGVKVATIAKTPWSHTLRVLGRVTPDETLVYRVTAPIACTIQEARPVTTGSLVKKNDLLGTFYSPEYRSSMQTYFNMMKTDKPQADKTAAGSVPNSPFDIAADNYRKSLFNYGLSEYQLEEMVRTRTIPDYIEIRAPASGFIFFRNISAGLRVDRGAELFRIADLSRIWVSVDVFENEASFFRPGARVRMELPYQRKSLYAKISEVLPQFDSATRTLKIRLTADNPGYVMRPDMFVNVDLPLTGPPAIIVPLGAVLDSGLRRTVFVDRGNGWFEPRQVETGHSLGERIEISRGLVPGEKIVLSGNFLIDSEARMQQAASGILGKIGRDPVCGMNVDEDRAKMEGNVREYKGKSYYFCSRESRDDFDKDPKRYLKLSD